MARKLISNLFKKKRVNADIDPDEIFLDSRNLPSFDRSQFEGRLDRPISSGMIFALAIFFLLIAVVYSGKLWTLQVKKGEAYGILSENNRLKHTIIYADRGIITDRNNQILAYNDINNEAVDFSKRRYGKMAGISALLGYVKYPQKDKKGIYFDTKYEGIDGVEKYYDKVLAGQNGLKIVETNAFGDVESESTLYPTKNGQDMVLTIDSRVQQRMYQLMNDHAVRRGFIGGAGMIMDVNTGELLAYVNYPEYDSNIMTEGDNKKAIAKFSTDSRMPFLDRATSGLYTPGSIIKPFLALGALQEKIIDQKKIIVSEGSISVQNPFDPTKKTVFKDWKAHGALNMKKALAYSSNVYFFEIGGGFEDQKGLGIANIEKYLNLFGFGKNYTGSFFDGPAGVIPNPKWKEKNFDGDIWRIGDTYNTSIGQYGLQVTPLQALIAVAAIANRGLILEPEIVMHNWATSTLSVPIDKNHFDVIREGMRLGAIDGTAKILNMPEVEVAAKTGTAEVGVSKKYVNTWVTGFFPYKKPRFAFTVIMERGPYDNPEGAASIMKELLEWMSIYTPEYIQTD